MVGMIVLGLLALVALLLWLMRDIIAYTFEVLLYSLGALTVGIVRIAVEIVNFADDTFGAPIASEAAWRALIVGAAGFVLGFGFVLLKALARGATWVPATLIISTLVGMGLGLVADPDRDWRIGPFPTFGHRDDNSQTPLNL
jgi:hypothetical protein